MPEDNGITQSSDWRRGEPLTLPSGRKILAARPSLISLIGSGVFPNNLLSAARRVLESNVKLGDDNIEELPGMLKVIDITASRCFVEPECVYEGTPEPGQIHIEWVDDDDKSFLMVYFQQGVKALEAFRDQRGASKKSGRSSSKVRAAAKQPAGS